MFSIQKSTVFKDGNGGSSQFSCLNGSQNYVGVPIKCDRVTQISEVNRHLTCLSAIAISDRRTEVFNWYARMPCGPVLFDAMEHPNFGHAFAD